MRRIALARHLILSCATTLVAPVVVTLAFVTGAYGQGASTSATSVTAVAAEVRQAFPADVATRILARVAAAQSHGLPGVLLAQRALKFAARGVSPLAIEQSVNAHAERMARAKEALDRPPKRHPTTDEIEAGAEAIREGVDGRLVSALAKNAPPGRSLVVSLYVMGSLTVSGRPADQALAKVEAMLNAHASDEDLESLLNGVAVGSNHGDSHDNGLGAAERHRGDDEGVGAGAGNGGGIGNGVGNGGAGTGGPPANVPGKGGPPAKPPHGSHSHH